jgi:hypothetical protein
MATKKTKKTDTKDVVVTKGSHLTVYTYQDGTTQLEWDDAALMRDVQDAIKAHEATQLVGAIALGSKPTTKTRKKA